MTDCVFDGFGALLGCLTYHNLTGDYRILRYYSFFGANSHAATIDLALADSQSLFRYRNRTLISGRARESCAGARVRFHLISSAVVGHVIRPSFGSPLLRALIQIYGVGKLTPGEAWLPINQPSNVTFLPAAE